MRAVCHIIDINEAKESHALLYTQDAASTLAGVRTEPSSARLPLKVVMHAGGVLHDATIGSQSLQGLRKVLAPKVSAAAAFGGSDAGALTPDTVLFSMIVDVGVLALDSVCVFPFCKSTVCTEVLTPKTPAPAAFDGPDAGALAPDTVCVFLMIVVCCWHIVLIHVLQL